MPRRLIIGILIVLILGIVGGTIALIVQRLNRDDTSATPTPSPGALNPAGRGNQQVTNPTSDDDTDGLTNAEEAVWGTNPNKADSDGDTYADGEEVAANHNPTVPAPNDKLPENFIPGQNVQPLTATVDTPLAVDQFFVNKPDLTLGTKNYTQEYQGKYPEDQRTPDTLVAFAKSQPITTRLPTPATESIKLQSTDTPLVLAEYLDIAGNLGVFSNRTILATAINDVYGQGNTDIMAGIADSVRAHQQRVATLQVPPTAVSLQRLLLGYTELLAATYDEITSYNDDPVKAVVALYRLELIDKQYYPLIESEVDRLHQYEQTLGGQVSGAQATITH